MMDKSQSTNEFSIRDLILLTQGWVAYIVGKWKFIFLFAILGALGGVGYSMLKSDSYMGTTVFVLEEDKGGGGGLGSIAGLASIAGVDVGGGGGIFQGENILQLYKSRTMIEQTLLSPSAADSSTLLVDLYLKFTGIRDKWKGHAQLSNLKFEKLNRTRLQDSVLGDIVKNINKENLVVEKPDKKLGIIKVTVRSPNESFSKLFNDRIVQNVNEFYVRTKTKKSENYVNILQQKTDSVRAVMRGAIYAGANTQDATPNLNPTRQVLRASVQTYQFSAETNRTVLEELVKNLELSKMTLKKETPLIQVIDKPVFPLEKAHLSIVKAVVIGVILAIFIALVCVILRKSYRDILAD